MRRLRLGSRFNMAWRRAFVDGSPQQKIRGSVNGNGACAERSGSLATIRGARIVSVFNAIASFQPPHQEARS